MADETHRIGVVARILEKRKFIADARDEKRAISEMGDETDEFGRKTRATAEEVGVLRTRIKGLVDTHRKHHTTLNSLGGALSNVNTVFTFFRNIMRTITIAAVISAIGFLAQALSAAAAGAIALSGALGPLSGQLAVVAPLATALAQGMGIWSFAMKDLIDAVGGSEAAQKRLTAEGFRFFMLIESKIKPGMESLREAVQRPLFSRLTTAFKEAIGNLKILRPLFRATGIVLGDLAIQFGKQLGGREWGRDIETQGKRNVVIIQRFGRAGIMLANAFRHLVLAAKPLTDFVTRLALRFSRYVMNAAEAGRESGRLQAFFRRSIQVTKQLIRIFQNLGGAIFRIGKAGAPLGQDLLNHLERASFRFSAWTRSARGQNTLAKYFRDAHDPLIELGRLMSEGFKMFFRLGTAPGLDKTIAKIRTDLLPVLEQTIATVTAGFGPTLIFTLTQFVRLLGQLANETGPLTVFVRVLGMMAGGLATLMEEAPVLRHLLVGVLSLSAGIKALALGKAMMMALVGSFKLLKPAILKARIELALLRVQYAMLLVQEKAALLMTKLRTASIWLHTKAMRVNRITTVLSTAATKAWAAAQWLLNAAMLANPFVLAAVAIVALVAAIVIAYHKVDWFHKLVDSVWKWIKTNWPLLLGILAGPIGLAAVLIIKHWTKIKNFVIGAARTVLGFFRNNWRIILILMTGPIGLAVGLITKHWGKLKSATGAVIDWIEGAWNDFIAFMEGMPGRIANAARGMFRGIRDAFKSAVNWIIDAWNGLEFGIPGFDPPGPGPKFGGITIGTPNIPRLHTGGPVFGTNEVMSVLKVGEHVWTPREVKAAGGHGAVAALRNFVTNTSSAVTNMNTARSNVVSSMTTAMIPEARRTDLSPVAALKIDRDELKEILSPSYHLYIDGREMTEVVARRTANRQARK